MCNNLRHATFGGGNASVYVGVFGKIDQGVASMNAYRKIWKHVKYAIRFVRKFFCEITNFIFLRPLECYYAHKMGKLGESSQVFILGRSDFGVFALHLHYISLWQKVRGQTCVVVATIQYKAVKTFIEQISPQSDTLFVINPIIRAYIFLFGKHITQSRLYSPIYAWLSFQRQDRQEIFVQLAESNKKKVAYSRYLDAHFRSEFPKPNFSHDAYVKLREHSHLNYDSFVDFTRLSKSHAPVSNFPKLVDTFSELKEKLGIKRPFIVMNLNCKWYDHPQQNSRRIHHPETYSDAIDFLIEAGYQVIIQGRQEQYDFAPREFLIPYFRMAECSLLNDLAIYANCEWAITSRTGPEVFPLYFDKPVLGLNYTECWHLMPYKRFRLFPKHVVKLNTGDPISWKEMLDHPALYCFGSVPLDDSIEYRDLTSDEILMGVKEFLDTVQKKLWEHRTEQQEIFQSHVTPFHLDLYYGDVVPCDVYLSLKYHNTHKEPSVSLHSDLAT